MASQREVVKKLYDHQGYRFPPQDYEVVAWAEAGVYAIRKESITRTVEFLKHEQIESSSS